VLAVSSLTSPASVSLVVLCWLSFLHGGLTFLAVAFVSLVCCICWLSVLRRVDLSCFWFFGFVVLAVSSLTSPASVSLVVLCWLSVLHGGCDFFCICFFGFVVFSVFSLTSPALLLWF
jgi:hypothetical protein